VLVLGAGVLVGWSLRRMRVPRRYTLTAAGILEIRVTLGRDRDLGIRDLADDRGTVVDRSTGMRYAVGNDEYEGAGEFHRALRARLALLPGARGP
jgi:hypothetical protein